MHKIIRTYLIYFVKSKSQNVNNKAPKEFWTYSAYTSLYYLALQVI